MLVTREAPHHTKERTVTISKQRHRRGAKPVAAAEAPIRADVGETEVDESPEAQEGAALGIEQVDA